MEACNEVVDQLRTLDEAEERVGECRRHYIERGQALVADKDAWIKTWQAKARKGREGGCLGIRNRTGRSACRIVIVRVV